MEKVMDNTVTVYINAADTDGWIQVTISGENALSLEEHDIENAISEFLENKNKHANRFYGEQNINPGYYGVVKFDGFSRGASGAHYAEIEVSDILTADELREAAHLFVQLAEALERE